MTEQPFPRILIGAESVADAPRALQLFPVLAGGGAAMLGGLLVLDQALADKRANPGRRVVTPTGQLVAMPDTEELNRIVESETRAFRKMLAEIAATTGADWSADVKTGTLGANLAEVANAWDIVVIGHRLLHRRRGRVVILSSGPEAGSDVGAVAARMASELDTEVERIERPVGEDRRRDWFTDRLDRLSASAVILDAATVPLDGSRQLASLLSAARCPIVILRSGQLRSKLEHGLQIASRPEQDT